MRAKGALESSQTQKQSVVIRVTRAVAEREALYLALRHVHSPRQLYHKPSQDRKSASTVTCVCLY